MLQNIVFQDNIFQLVRTIDTLREGLLLDLSPDYFFEKTVDDMLFFVLNHTVYGPISSSTLNVYPDVERLRISIA